MPAEALERRDVRLHHAYSFASRLAAACLERARLRRILVQRLLHGVADQHPATLGAGNCALDHDEAALDVGLDDLQVLRRDAHVAHVAGHLLALEHLAGVLALTGRAVAAVADRHAVRGAQAAEVPALHGALEALALVGAGHVDELTGDEVVGGDLGADLDHVVGADPELDQLALRLDLGDGEVLPLGLGEARRLARAGTELQRGVAVLVVGAVSDDLTVVELQHGHGDVLPGIREDAGHAHLLCNHSGAHQSIPSS